MRTSAPRLTHPEAHPYDVLAPPGRVLPVDSSGECAGVENNTESGFGCDPVPAGIVLGPDGLLYVSGLGGEVGRHVWQIHPGSGEILQTWSDLPPLTGIAVAPDGTLYVSALGEDEVLRPSAFDA